MKSVAVLLLLLSGCVTHRDVDADAIQNGDPGAQAWSCASEDFSWTPQTVAGGQKWGGTCTDAWTCDAAVFSVRCKAQLDGVYSTW